MTTLIADRESKEAHYNNTYTARTSLETRDQAAQTTVPYVDFRVEQAERAAQALAVSVHYLAFEVRAASSSVIVCHFNGKTREIFANLSA